MMMDEKYMHENMNSRSYFQIAEEREKKDRRENENYDKMPEEEPTIERLKRIREERKNNENREESISINMKSSWHNDDNNYYDDDNHNNYNRNTGPGVSSEEETKVNLTPEQCDKLAEYYEAAIGKPLNQIIAKDIIKYMEYGLTFEEIIIAIKETAYAPVPTPAYLRAILKRWVDTGTTIMRQTGTKYKNGAQPWWKRQREQQIRYPKIPNSELYD